MSSDEEIAGDARWLAHRFDFRADAYEFAFMPRAVHAETSFLNEQHMEGVRERRTVARATAAKAPKDQAPLHFIFHSGLTLSTLLARALDAPGAAMTLKEPSILNDVVAFALSGGGGRERSQALDDALALLARPFEAEEPVIVKTASVANGLGEAILHARGETRALCLYAPLPVFLASIARKGLFGRLWGRKLFVGLRNAGMANLGFSDEEQFAQTDLQIAATAWLAQQRMFARLIDRFGPDRVRSMDCETVAARPAHAIAAIAGHFELAMEPDRIREILDGPLFRTHAKSGEEFDLEQRAEELGVARPAHRDEIEKVTIWAEKVADTAGFSIQLGAKLVDQIS
jgi:hypothetical protein